MWVCIIDRVWSDDDNIVLQKGHDVILDILRLVFVSRTLLQLPQ